MGSMHVVVVGAGAFGGWTALECARRGADVTLVDAWEPGHSRASSGGDTRVIRHGYGPQGLYVDMVRRALEHWRRAPEELGESLFDQTGVLWLVQDDEEFELLSLADMQREGVPVERLDLAEIGERWPQICLDGVRWGMLEPTAGALHARRACRAVVRNLEARGGTLVRGKALPIQAESGPLNEIQLADGRRLQADQFVFAGGPWMGEIFGELLGPLLQVTRQEVFTFGPPAGDGRFDMDALPAWADHSEHFWYGIPGNDARGFKLGRDTIGAQFDPTTGERQANPEELADVREYLAMRFPAMAGAPLLESRVCQYTNTPDRQPIIDLHPMHPNVRLMAGASGHGFKLGPVFGEDVAEWIFGGRRLDPSFDLARF